MKQASWKPDTLALDIANLAQILSQKSILVIHVWAIWDWHDRDMDANLQEVIPYFTERIAFYSLNLDIQANMDFCSRIGLVNIPALVCFVDGVWHETLIGIYSPTKLMEKFESWLSSAKVTDC